MAERVYVHIGLPKTGTTYLQQILWGHREQLQAAGYLLPGSGHREHLWAALALTERKGLARRHPRAPGAWDRIADEVAAWPGQAVITHEFFCAASREQVERLLHDLAPAEVHVLVTARHALGMLTAGWQEYVKNGGTRSLAEIAAAGGKRGRGAEFSWRTWDLGGVLKRYGAHVAADRLHVLPVPAPDSPSDQHWRNLAGVLGLDPRGFRAPEATRNPSLGVVQVELLRHLNEFLGDFRSAHDRGTWIRGYLAEQRLAEQRSERIGVTDDQLADCRARSEAAVRLIRRRGHPVVGDLDSLLVPETPASGLAPEEVDQTELIEACGRLVADMLSDVRDLRGEIKHLGSARRGARP